ncbi:MAG: GH74, partial [uncultured Solirubrobacteraceae bacterium]
DRARAAVRGGGAGAGAHRLRIGLDRRRRRTLGPPRRLRQAAAVRQRAGDRAEVQGLPAHDEPRLLSDRPRLRSCPPDPGAHQLRRQARDRRNVPRARRRAPGTADRFGPPRPGGHAARLPRLHPLRRRRQDLARRLAPRRRRPAQDRPQARPDVRLRRGAQRAAGVARRRPVVYRGVHAARADHRLRGRSRRSAPRPGIQRRRAVSLQGHRRLVAPDRPPPGHPPRMAGAGPPVPRAEGRHRADLRGRRRDLEPCRQGERRAIQVQGGQHRRAVPRAQRRHDHAHDRRRQDVEGGVPAV